MANEQAAKWREDFPIGSAGEEEVTRREFVRYLVLASGAFAAGNVAVAAWTSMRTIDPGEARPIVSLDQVSPGGAYLFRYPTEHDPAILLRLQDGELRAFSQKCTHLGCVVYWHPPRDRLTCPCHEGYFDPRSGRVLSGPPQRPLPVIAVELRADGKVWALGMERS